MKITTIVLTEEMACVLSAYKQLFAIKGEEIGSFPRLFTRVLLKDTVPEPQGERRPRPTGIMEFIDNHKDNELTQAFLSVLLEHNGEMPLDQELVRREVLAFRKSLVENSNKNG